MSTFVPGAARSIISIVESALVLLRAVRTRSAPFCASATAVYWPMPLVPPVSTTVGRGGDMGVPTVMDIYPLCNDSGYLSTNLAMATEAIGRRGIMISHSSKAPRDGGRREERIRALGAVLNVLVSQS